MHNDYYVIKACRVLHSDYRRKQQPNGFERKRRGASDESIVTMKDIDAELELLFEMELNGGNRKLKDNTCWHGGQAQGNLTWPGRNWGSCQKLDPCFCGMHPLRMAYLCPELCRPSCGGSCATPESCLKGFNIENGSVVPYVGKIEAVVYQYRWPESYGTPCKWYPNPGAPSPSPVPSAAPSQPTNTRGTGGTPPPTPAPIKVPATPSPTPATNKGNGCLIPEFFGGCRQ